MSASVRRIAVLLTSLALAVTVMATPAQAAHPRADLGAEWLTAQLTDGLVHNDLYDVDDYGLSIDTGLGLRAVGGHRAAVRQIRNAVADHIASYTTGVDFGSADIYAGALAKALVFAQVSNGDERDFGGVDLPRELNRRVSLSAPIAGRIQDRTAGDDFANVIGQAFAVEGLAKAGSPRAVPALGFLLKQQCSQGYFRLNFSASKTRRNQSCDGGRHATTSAPDTDVTAIAVLSLRSLRSKRPVVENAIDDAVTWLKRRQKLNGSFGGGTSTEASNANSTGLAGWALGAEGACRSALLAARWVRHLQVAGETTGTLAEENGAIAYSSGALMAGQVDGITVETRDQWRRATAQAAPALDNLSVGGCRAG
jgi:hypothetical protein